MTIYLLYSLVFGSRAWMWLVLAAIDGGVTHASVGRAHVDLGAHAVFLTLLRAFNHLLP